MAGPSWLVDKSRFATKIKCASGNCDPNEVVWKSNPTRACPNCEHAIDNSDVGQEWPGLPKGVKFDPSDQEIIWHLLAKAGVGNLKPHPFIDEFITTLEVDDGICYTHPQHLPGVKQDGNASHFFHRSVKAYNTGTRKRRRIHDEDFGDVRWHKTGRTKPIILNGVPKGCKKIMVLYTSAVRGGKSEKTNWVMHQYHLGTEEDEKEGEYVISKIFYQQQQVKLGDKDEQDIPRATNTINATTVKVDPVTPKSVTPEPPRSERQCSDLDLGEETLRFLEMDMDCLEALQADREEFTEENLALLETQRNKGMDNKENNADEGQQGCDIESQNFFDSQEMADAMPWCEEILQSQSPNRDGKNGKDQPSLSDYAHLGPEQLKKDIEECQNLVLDEKNDKNRPGLSFDAHLGPANQNQEIVEYQNLAPDEKSDKDQPSLSGDAHPEPEDLNKDTEDCQNLDLDSANIERDTPPEHRLSQLDFSSQDSYTAWGYSMAGN